MKAMESITGLFKALSEPVRLRVIALLLAEREICVCDLTDILSLSQSVVSRHMAYLRHHQLVTSRRAGVWVYYQIPADKKIQLNLLIKFIQLAIQDNHQIQKDLRKLHQQQLCK